MPGNKDFRADILISGVPVPEYEKDGQYYVECNLNTPYTYKEKASEYVNGEREEQEYPVTPYQIKITALSGGDFPNYYRVRVDGIKVKGLSLQAGESRQIKGFRDGTSVRELLFSMPRFARDVDDRVTAGRRSAIGTIEVECWLATLQTRRTEMRANSLDFQQANKKDSNTVTNGKYMMATSRVGKVVCERSFARTVDSWKLMSLLSTLTVQYRMAESLCEMGFNVRQPRFPPSAGGQNDWRRLMIKRGIKNEPGEGAPSGRKRRKAHRNKARSGKKQEAAKALLDLQTSAAADPQPGPSNNGSKSPDMGDDDIEILGIVRPQIIQGGVPRPKAEPELIDLTERDDDDDDVDMGASVAKLNERVKQEKDSSKDGTVPQEEAGEDAVVEVTEKNSEEKTVSDSAAAENSRGAETPGPEKGMGDHNEGDGVDSTSGEKETEGGPESGNDETGSASKHDDKEDDNEDPSVDKTSEVPKAPNQEETLAGEKTSDEPNPDSSEAAGVETQNPDEETAAQRGGAQAEAKTSSEKSGDETNPEPKLNVKEADSTCPNEKQSTDSAQPRTESQNTTENVQENM